MTYTQLASGEHSQSACDSSGLQEATRGQLPFLGRITGLDDESALEPNPVSRTGVNVEGGASKFRPITGPALERAGLGVCTSVAVADVEGAGLWDSAPARSLHRAALDDASFAHG